MSLSRTRDIRNPELDQLAGRFGHQRGFFGLLLCRAISNRDRIVAGCRDTVGDGRGYLIALEDADMIEMLEMIIDNNRAGIDRLMGARLDEISN